MSLIILILFYIFGYLLKTKDKKSSDFKVYFTFRNGSQCIFLTNFSIADFFIIKMEFFLDFLP